MKGRLAVLMAALMIILVGLALPAVGDQIKTCPIGPYVRGVPDPKCDPPTTFKYDEVKPPFDVPLRYARMCAAKIGDAYTWYQAFKVVSP